MQTDKRSREESQNSVCLISVANTVFVTDFGHESARRIVVDIIDELLLG